MNTILASITGLIFAGPIGAAASPILWRQLQADHSLSEKEKRQRWVKGGLIWSPIFVAIQLVALPPLHQVFKVAEDTQVEVKTETEMVATESPKPRPIDRLVSSEGRTFDQFTPFKQAVVLEAMGVGGFKAAEAMAQISEDELLQNYESLCEQVQQDQLSDATLRYLQRSIESSMVDDGFTSEEAKAGALLQYNILSSDACHLMQ